MNEKPKWTLESLAGLIITVKDEVTGVKTKFEKVETDFNNFKTETRTDIKKIYGFINHYHKKTPPSPPTNCDPNFSLLKKTIVYKFLKLEVKDAIINKLN